jgi:hypothetical protein
MTLNYRGISLLNSGYKIYTKILARLKTISEAILLEEQNGFRRGRSCICNVFTLKQTIQKIRCHLLVPIVMKSGSLNLLEPSGPVKACNGIALPLREFNLETRMAFLDLEKAFDRVN